MARAYISLGSNIDPERNLSAALEQLAGRFKLAGQFKLLGLSTIYRTPAVGPSGTPARWAGRPQDDYLNAVAAIRTDLLPADLSAELSRIEQRLGRVRQADRFAPRTIDLDLLAYVDDAGRVELNRPKLAADHARLPLAELAGELLASAGVPAEGTAVPAGFVPMAELTQQLRRALVNQP